MNGKDDSEWLKQQRKEFYEWMEIDIEQPIKKEGANFGTTYLDIIIIFLYDTVGQIKRQGHLDCIACMRKCKLKIEATAALKGVPSLV